MPAVAQAEQAELSSYEKETLALVKTQRGVMEDVAPEGKRIEAIDVVVLDVIEARDPAPRMLNILHSNSRDAVIRREILVEVGQTYRDALVRESERNMRALRQLSLVLLRATRGRDDKHVRLLAIVKDVWSLRLNTNYRFKAGQLEYLFLQPAEENLFGTHRQVLGAFTYEPDTLSFGGRVADRRIAGSRYQAVIDANGIVGRESGKAEGSFGSFQYGLPLFSTQQRWSWGSHVLWHQETTRRHVGIALARFDALSTPQDDAIPHEYDTDILAGQFSVTRSFGTSIKHDLRVGVSVQRSVFRAHDLSAYEAEAQREYVDTILPVSDTRNGPFVQYHLYANQWRSLLDFETLGLQENYRQGPELYLRVQAAPRFLRSSRDLIRYHAGTSWTVAPAGGLFRAYAAAALDLELDGAVVSDARLQAGFRLATPRLGPASFKLGRFVYDATTIYRPHNYLNTRVAIGGSGRLRGYPTGYFVGEELMAANLEFRTRPIQLWTVQLAATAFYDVGDAFDGWSQLRPKHGAGAGLRILLPQLGRSVIRADWGFALTPGYRASSPLEGLLITFRQAFATPSLNALGVTTSNQ
ncbi:MAG: hypothetical protein VB934_05440 [Polyangiaceae bacterium]